MASENETVASVSDCIRHLADNLPNGAILNIAQCNFTADRIESAWRREKAELVECLKEAITRFCTHRPHQYDDGFGNCENYKNGSCECSECWVLDSINKWRKALDGGES